MRKSPATTKPARNRRHQLTEGFPFLLPGHTLTWASLEKHLPPRKRDAVSRVPISWPACPDTHGTIYRLAAEQIKTRRATPPTFAEQLQAWPRFKNLPELKDADPHDLASLASAALIRLADKARTGDGKALWHFAQITANACRALDQMTAHDRKAMRPIARTMLTWPMPRSRYKRNCSPDAWLDEMRLGQDLPIAQGAQAKWKPCGWATRYALELYGHLERIRQDREITIDRKPPRQWLPPFTRKTAVLWWNVARQFLLASYPNPERVSELNRLVTAPTKRKSPGRIRAEILALLKTRFLSIAHDPHAAAHALHFCECSNPATHKSGPDWICDRCRALEV